MSAFHSLQKVFFKSLLPSAKIIFAALLSIFFFTACNQHQQTRNPQTVCSDSIPFANRDHFSVDEKLQYAATLALQGREGAVIVMDPQSGRVRAVVNSRLAFEQAFPPGSAIKPFTALAALREGILNTDTRKQCCGGYRQHGIAIACSHPASRAPLTLPQALAYSCNDFFATIGERLSEGAFNATLASFGFGARTGINANESAGNLPRCEWNVREAIGEHPQLLVTPVQLITAYCALVNGGRLYQPLISASEKIIATPRERISISPSQRNLLLDGMRGAVHYGTAAGAHLTSLPFDIFGKTGTSSSSNGFRTQGWFVGFAADRKLGKELSPKDITLAVLVFLKRAHGAECAAVSRAIFEEFSNCAERVAESATEHILPTSTHIGQCKASQLVRVRVVHADTTLALPLEAYVRGVLRGEAGAENQLEAMKAQAIISRTFALKNLHRHANDGFDFCSTTHCQRFVEAPDHKNNSATERLIDRAVAETEGEIVCDARGEIADVYYHAACGGLTANAQTLWGGAAPEYLRGVRDEYCAAMPHRHWTETISSAELLRALQRDSSSDVGATLRNVFIADRDATGRAALITLDGEHRKTIRGWNFKLIVGRTLGWNVLKSSKFEIQKSGTDFIFQGFGFGHGVGLCQEGAHVMAQRGTEHQKIIAHYFPGAHVARVPSANTSSMPDEYLSRGIFKNAMMPIGDNPLQPSSTHQSAQQGIPTTVSGEHFRITVPSDVTKNETASAMQLLIAARADMHRRLMRAGIGFPREQKIEIVFHASTHDFAKATGRVAWVAAVTHNLKIDLQPLDVLRKRGVLETTLRHEYVHTVIDALSHGRAPHWLEEGLAAYVSGESKMLEPFEPKENFSTDELEQKISNVKSSDEMQMLYAAACREIRDEIKSNGENAVWKKVAE